MRKVVDSNILQSEELRSYLAASTENFSARESKLATDDGCHLPPRADLNPRRFSSKAID